MARAWIYDRNESKSYRESVARARKGKRKPPQRYLVCYVDKTGKQRQESAATKSQAEARQTELLASLAGGTYIDPTVARVKFEEVAEKWLESRVDIRPSTWWNYRGLLDNHVLPQWGDMPVDAIDGEDIRAWIAKLLKSDRGTGGALGPSTVRLAYGVLAMVLDWCVPRRLNRNPARGIKLPAVPEAEHVYLTYAQVEALADSASGLTTKYSKPTAMSAVNRALILLLAYTGMR